jgi:hypothetical protein
MTSNLVALQNIVIMQTAAIQGGYAFHAASGTRAILLRAHHTGMAVRLTGDFFHKQCLQRPMPQLRRETFHTVAKPRNASPTQYTLEERRKTEKNSNDGGDNDCDWRNGSFVMALSFVMGVEFSDG